MTFDRDLKGLKAIEAHLTEGWLRWRKELMEKSKGESMANVLKDKEGGKCNWTGFSDGESDRGGEDR